MPNQDRLIEITLHARERMEERGASEDDIRTVLRLGLRKPAEHGRWIYQDTLPFHGLWRGRRYSARRVAAVVAEESDRDVVITVFVFYLRSEVTHEDDV
jgi:hypothetical protein